MEEEVYRVSMRLSMVYNSFYLALKELLCCDLRESKTLTKLDILLQKRTVAKGLLRDYRKSYREVPDNEVREKMLIAKIEEAKGLLTEVYTLHNQEYGKHEVLDLTYSQEMEMLKELI